jgi:hypothetical protein
MSEHNPEREQQLLKIALKLLEARRMAGGISPLPIFETNLLLMGIDCNNTEEVERLRKEWEKAVKKFSKLYGEEVVKHAIQDIGG